MSNHRNVVEIDLSGVVTEEQLVGCLGAALELGGPDDHGSAPSPSSRSGWGRNWNALADSLCYLDSGGIWGTSRRFAFPLILRFTNSQDLRSRNPSSLAILVDILQGVRAKYAEHSMQFHVEFS
jgi:hypothetical protein